MIAARCQACGSPCRVPLTERVEIHCHHCGARGPAAEAIALRVRAALRVLDGVAVRQRQFSGLRRTVASSVAGALLVHVALTAVVAVMSAAITNSCQRGLRFGAGSGLDPNLLPSLAVIVTLCLSLLPLLGLLRARKKLRSIARALSPLLPGAPTACRVCGGPIAGLGVVRCTYCAADNVVDAEVMQQVGQAHDTTARVLEDEVSSQARAIGEARGLGFPLVASLALLPTPFVIVWFGPPALAPINLEVDPSLRFPLDEHGDVVRVAAEGQSQCITEVSACDYPTAGCLAHDPVPFRWLVGKTTLSRDTIVAVRRNLVTGYQAVTDKGRVLPFGPICVASEPTEGWKKLVADTADREQKDRAERDRLDAKWKSLGFDGGFPALQPVPVTLPPIPIPR